MLCFSPCFVMVQSVKLQHHASDGIVSLPWCAELLTATLSAWVSVFNNSFIHWSSALLGSRLVLSSDRQLSFNLYRIFKDHSTYIHWVPWPSDHLYELSVSVQNGSICFNIQPVWGEVLCLVYRKIYFLQKTELQENKIKFALLSTLEAYTLDMQGGKTSAMPFSAHISFLP